MDKVLYTVEETAILLRMDEKEVYNLISLGLLRALKLNVLKITKFEILRYIKNNKIIA
ncbi:MAG: helix-turn-helix domain-containing protein [Clostridiaceae bacterium]